MKFKHRCIGNNNHIGPNWVSCDGSHQSQLPCNNKTAFTCRVSYSIATVGWKPWNIPS